ncbi:MAG: class I SAM-dependent rRNA methyltransferase [Bacteroidales bacterium]|nr:class I SAM-dependent rRNA methyltransferase [Bacteroidales bacterium]
MMRKRVILHAGKEKSLLRKHPWVFSGAIARADGQISDGEIVEVFDHQRQFLAMGHYHEASIAVRVFAFEKIEPDFEFWKNRVAQAWDYRQTLGITGKEPLTIFRLVNGEGDLLPGLIIDWYQGCAVMQFHSMGMYRLRETFARALQEIFGNHLKSIYDKSSSTLLNPNDLPVDDGYMFGKEEEVFGVEYGLPFYIDISRGQKTGFFIDQRENRRLLGEHARDRQVLNLFCYTGGFSTYALAGGAARVHSVDISSRAVEQTRKNIEHFSPEVAARHEAFEDNVFDFIEKMPPRQYDIIILDPPAFAKHHKVKEQGIKGYRNLNKKVMEKIKNGGLLFTFSCSQAVSHDDFQTMIFSAAALAHRDLQIVAHLQQAPDHPVSIFHPEGAYLKGLLLHVN